MNDFFKLTKAFYVPMLNMIILIIIISSFQCEAQSPTTLSQKEIDAIDNLFQLKYIGVKSDGWEINPDLWSRYNFEQRKKFTEKLSIFYKNYTEVGKQMSGFCYFYNMATKKKIARWYNLEIRNTRSSLNIKIS